MLSGPIIFPTLMPWALLRALIQFKVHRCDKVVVSIIFCIRMQSRKLKMFYYLVQMDGWWIAARRFACITSINGKAMCTTLRMEVTRELIK